MGALRLRDAVTRALLLVVALLSGCDAAPLYCEHITGRNAVLDDRTKITVGPHTGQLRDGTPAVYVYPLDSTMGQWVACSRVTP